MRHVLIVDDERIIREGLSKGFDWEAHGYIVCGLAADGTSALEMIRQYQPELVMLDIRMPDMDGLELIAKSQSLGFHPYFVILSGYSEFEYAKRAMSLGVKYYLTKPCKDSELTDTIEAVSRAVQEEQERDTLLRNRIETHKDSLSQIQEQIIQQAIAGEKSTVGESNGWILAELRKLNLQLILLAFPGAAELKSRLRLRDSVMEYSKSATYSRCLLFQDLVVWIVSAMAPGETEELIHGLETLCRGRFPEKFSASFSLPGSFDCLHGMYRQALIGLEFQLQAEEQTADGVRRPVFHPAGQKPIATEAFLRRIYADDFRGIGRILADCLPPDSAGNLHRLKAVCLSICLNMAFEVNPDGAFAMMESLCHFDAAQTDGQVLLQAETLLLEIAARSPDPRMGAYSPATQKAVQYIEAHLENSDISLSYLAKNILFMHEDYIGKLFAKDTGIKFTQYIKIRRILAAVEMFRTQPDIRVFEVCEKSGFGSNTQYFSRVFKDMTGYTPSEFCKLP